MNAENTVPFKVTYKHDSIIVKAPKDAPTACLMGWYWETYQKGAPTLEAFAQIKVQEVLIQAPELNYEQLADYAKYQQSAILWGKLIS